MNINDQVRIKRVSNLRSKHLRLLFNCKNCRLHKFRDCVVPGKGKISSNLLFIGEAPGRSENITGEPFVGPSGRLLREMIKDAIVNINVKLSYYIMNMIMCRPCDSKNAPNREPRLNEILSCKENFYSIVNLIKPKIICFIGKVSEKYYKSEFPNHFSIQHPAFLLRSGGRGSSWYNSNIRILEDVFKSLIKG